MSGCPVHRYRLALTVQAPILTASTASGGYGLDAVAARRHDGRWMVAGTHVTGKLFQAIEELHEESGGCFDEDGTTRALFRVRATQGEHDHDDFARARIHIGDLVTDEVGDAAGQRTRIATNDVSGAAEAGALQVMQAPFPPGAEIDFEGILTILADGIAPDEHIARLRRALHWIPQIGSGRTTGMGRLRHASLEPIEDDGHGPILDRFRRYHGDTPPTRFRLVLSFEEGFCCAEPTRHHNVFASEGFVSGAVIKGAIAEQMLAMAGRRGGGDAVAAAAAYPHLASHLRDIRIAHAFPTALTVSGALTAAADAVLQAETTLPERPRVPPLSLALFGKRLFDLALAEEDEFPPEWTPAFRSDWKGSALAEANALTGWCEPRRELRVRTRMSREHRAAEAESLFAIETAVPDGRVWLGEIDITACPDDRTREDARAELEALLRRGLYGIGKTNAFARVHLVPLPDPQPVDVLQGELVVVTLQTPALLLGPDATATSGPYGAAFEELAGKVVEGSLEARDGGESAGDHPRKRVSARKRGEQALKLTAVFAEERLLGGMYVAMRVFRGCGVPYRPFLLTQPGATFVFEVRDAVAAKHVLAHWARHGLDIPDLVLSGYVASGEPGQDGRNATTRRVERRVLPFVRQNGFGEVVINDEVHWAMRPYRQAVPGDDP